MICFRALKRKVSRAKILHFMFIHVFHVSIFHTIYVYICIYVFIYSCVFIFTYEHIYSESSISYYLRPYHQYGTLSGF